jgi:hypothetical protein
MALINCDNQEWESAMLHACNAVDGTARKRYPTEQNAARFKKTLRDSLDILRAFGLSGIDLENTRFPVLVETRPRGQRPDIADVVYGIHRCTHGHGDELPDGFELTPYEGPDGPTTWTLKETETGNPQHPTAIVVQLPTEIIFGLLAIAVFAPENKDQVVPNDGYYLVCLGQRFVINESWGSQDGLRASIADPLSRRPQLTMEFGDWWDHWTPK